MRNLKKGTCVGYSERLDEKLHSWAEYARLDSKTKRMIDKYCASTAEGFWGPVDINYISLPWHMNHCCAGNVGFNEQGDFVTIKYVRAGAELSYDYGLLITNPKFKLACQCGSRNCRKIITGNDWLDPSYRRKNTNIMAPELRDTKKTRKSPLQSGEL